MRIISWDVGVIHLAYTVLKYRYDKKTGKHKFRIIDWNVLNILDDEMIELPCCGFYKAKKKDDPSLPCCSKASYMLKLSDKVYGFCGMHLRQSENYWTDYDTERLYSDRLSSKEEKQVCCFKHRDETFCDKPVLIRYQHENETKYFCRTHYRNDLTKKLKELKPQPITNPSASSYPTGELQLKLVKELDYYAEHFSKLGIKKVFIENQPAMKNPKMKSIASTLYDWFLIRCYVDKMIDVDEVTFICPSNKLKINNENTLEVFKAEKGSKYKLTKKLGIEYTRQLLRRYPEQIEYLDTFDKQDDICDSFLQGLHRMMTTHDKKKKVYKPKKRKTRAKKITTTKSSKKQTILNL